ncbi:ornithine decarboxylase 1 [Anabrus simplex]|uniref:ornithine decarboxylase 1 n=1 Tax=Anabrus simplex TaxID=316456 RepID=UPI0034DDA9C4
MKIANLDERVHVLDAETDVFKVIRDIAQSGVQEEAFYVCDIGDVVRKHKEWKMKLPRVEPHYAVKCNDSYSVLEVLAALGTGFDCASKTEINKVLELGVDPSRIIFANPTKPASHIRHSAAVGVHLMTFDNETELHKIKSLFPTAKLVIRIRCDASVAQCQLGMKFGCDPVVEAPHLIHVAHLLGLDVVGVSFHVGSGCGDPPVFRRAIAAARNLFDFGATLGYQFHLLDLGGGYPGNKGTSIDKIAEIINSALDEYFPSPDVHIIAEPGRYYVASAYTLATNIHSKREVMDPQDNETVSHVMYYINDGVYGSFNCLLYDHAQVTPVPMTASSGKLIPSSIWGPTCDGLDQVVENMLLPPMDVGNWIIFENMGAYTLPVASTFNGFPIPKVHMVVDEHTWLMLKDVLPLTEEHFVLGNSPANLRIGLDLGGCGEIQEWGVPPALCHQVAAAESPIDQGVDHSSRPPAFLFEFVEVGPIN